MNKFLLMILVVLFAGNAQAAILCESLNGGSPYIPASLSVAATSNSCRNTNVVVTSALSAVQSNISSATVHAWPADRALKVEKGGSINPTTKFTGLPYAEPWWFGFSESVSGTVNQVALNKFTASLQSGGNGKMPVGNYAVTGLWTIATPCKIDMSGCTLNFSTDAANQGIRITSSNVKITGGAVHGPQFAATEATQIGIFAYGGNSSNYISGVDLWDIKVKGWAGSGIRFLFVENFKIDSPDVSDCYAEGIGGLSVRYGEIMTPRVDNVTAPTAATGGTYGIILSKNTGSEADYPVSHDIKLIHPVVSNVPTWEGIDTHAGYNILIDSPVITDCAIGITIAKYSSDALNLSPYNITVTNPLILNKTLPQADVMPAIVISADETSTSTYGRNISILGGTIENMGDSDAAMGSFGAAVYAYGIHNLKIKDMTLIKSGTHGVALDYLGENIDVSGNTIKGLVNATAAAIYVQPRSSSAGAGGVLANNTIDVVGTAFYAYGATTIDLIENKIVAATTHYAQNAGTYALQYWGRVDPVHITTIAWDPASIASAGNAAVTTADLPGVSSVVTARVGGMNRDLLGMTLNALTAATDTNKGTLELKLYNYTGAAIDIASTNFKVRFSKDQ